MALVAASLADEVELLQPVDASASADVVAVAPVEGVEDETVQGRGLFGGFGGYRRVHSAYSSGYHGAGYGGYSSGLYGGGYGGMYNTVQEHRNSLKTNVRQLNATGIPMYWCQQNTVTCFVTDATARLRPCHRS